MENPSIDQLRSEEYIYDPNQQPTVEVINGGSVLVNVIKSLKPGADLVGALAPTFSLKPMSFLEWMSELLTPKDYLISIAKETSEEKRMLLVSRFFAEAVSHMPQSGVQQVKGYNPILGEVFKCSWKHEDSESTFFSEQVSHHPPISAACIENEKARIKMDIVFQPKVKFSANIMGPSVQSHIEGIAKLYILDLKEEYTVHFPHYVCRNLIFGGSYCELNDTMKIESNTGFETQFTFKSKSNNQVTGSIRGKNFKYSIEGNSTDHMVAVDSGRAFTLLDRSKISKPPKIVRPVAEQDENESRRVWHLVTKNIFDKRLDIATRHKTSIEDHERAIKKNRDANDERWKPKYFAPITHNDRPVRLGSSTLYYKKMDSSTEEGTEKAE